MTYVMYDPNTTLVGITTLVVELFTSATLCQFVVVTQFVPVSTFVVNVQKME